MDANFDMIVDDGAEVGVGQASDAVAPISASSLCNAADAATNVETDIIPLSMTGASCAPAPESAVSQIQIPGINDGRKGIGEMKPETQNGGDPPVVGCKPTSSDSAAQLFLANGEWSKKDSLKSAIDLTGVNPCSVRYFEIGQDNTFHIGHVAKHNEDGFYLYTESQSHLSINGEPITGDPDKISGVLANYQFGGMTAVLNYLKSLGESSDLSSNVHCDVPTLVVEPIPTSADTTPDLEESSDVSTPLKMQTQSKGASVVTEVVDSQVLPEAPDWQVFNFVTMLNLLSDVIDTSDICDLIDGRDDGVIQYIRCGIQSEKIQVESREELSVLFLGQKLKPMTFNAFGNFLYALKHHGEEVALSVLHRIYSGVNEE